MGLTGERLLSKIESLQGSINLKNYKGNLRNVAIECGYISDKPRRGKKTNSRLFREFCINYWRALRDTDRKRTLKTKDYYDDLYKILLKKYTHLPTDKEKEEIEIKKRQRELYRKKNPPIKQGEVNQYFEDQLKEAYDTRKENEKRNIEFNKRKENIGLLLYEKLTGQELLNESLKLWSIGKKEKDIAVITGFRGGYKRENFRRAFAQAAGVELTSLNGMIKEMKEKEFLLVEKPKDIKNIEIIENSEKQEIFIDRTKITSQVKRLYRNPRFRENILKKHGSICICCGISMEKLIEAAHIIPVENKGNDDTGNGIPLCPTHHTAFDNFLFTINPSDKSIIYKEGLGSEDLQITKTKCDINVSTESLDYRFKLFNE